MSQTIKQRIRLVYGIILSVLILVASGALILACLSIFNSPEGRFSRETVATAFGRIGVLVWLAIGGVLVGAVLSIVLPEERGRVKPRREDRKVLAKLTADYDLSGLAPEAASALSRERTLRKRLTVLSVAVGVLATVPPIVWIALPGHFGVGDKNKEILVASAIVLGCFAVAMLTAFVCGLLTAASCRRERAAVKLAIANRTAVKREEPLPRRVCLLDKPATVWAVRGTVLVVAVVFIVLGVFNGGMHDVFGKAVRICTECIGLG